MLLSVWLVTSVEWVRLEAKFGGCGVAHRKRQGACQRGQREFWRNYFRQWQVTVDELSKFRVHKFIQRSIAEHPATEDNAMR